MPGPGSPSLNSLLEGLRAAGLHVTGPPRAQIPFPARCGVWGPAPPIPILVPSPSGGDLGLVVRPGQQALGSL